MVEKIVHWASQKMSRGADTRRYAGRCGPLGSGRGGGWRSGQRKSHGNDGVDRGQPGRWWREPSSEEQSTGRLWPTRGKGQ